MSMRVRRAPRRQSTRPGMSAHRHPRRRARRGSDHQSDPNRTNTPRCLTSPATCRPRGSCAVRIPATAGERAAMSGLDAGATKDQLTAVRGLLRRAEASRSSHLGAANAARESPRKTRIPRPERFGLGTPDGAGGTRTHKRDASHLRRCRNNGHSHPFSSGCDPLDPARMGIGWASPHHPPPSAYRSAPEGQGKDLALQYQRIVSVRRKAEMPLLTTRSYRP